MSRSLTRGILHPVGMRRSRPRAAFPAGVLLACLLVATGIAHARTTVMKGARPPEQFKILVTGLSDDQKRCLRYALKQWVMYDQAGAQGHTSHPSKNHNRNETADGVMTPGPDHHIDNAATTVDEKKHTLSSRSMSEWEFSQMKLSYGAASPFHAPGQEVQDPVTNPDAWFTENPDQAILKIAHVDQIPGYTKKVAGFMDFKLGTGTFAGQPSETKDGPATCWLRNDPGKHPNGVQRTWCYPSDTNQDGWITNEDAKCPENTLDYYQIIKHELGHWFCFWHKGAEFIEPVYNNPNPIPGTQGPSDETCCCPHCGGEFAEGPSPRVFFASNRPGGLGGLDIWSAGYNDDTGGYTSIRNLGPPVNSPFDETTPEATAGDAWLFFASNRPGGLGGFDLYVGFKTDTTTWGTVVALPVSVNSAADETSPMDWSNRMLFSSNRPGGYGDWDIYEAPKRVTESTYWDPAVNLGPGINTPFAEKDPMLADWDGEHADLYFASNRMGGLGGYDVYRAIRSEAGWMPATSLGPGVNSPANEVAPHIPPSNDRILFASDRTAGQGAGWEILQSLNFAPRLYSIAGHDVEGAPGDTLAAPFMVFNDGFLPLDVTGVAWSPETWTVLHDHDPFPVLPGQHSTLIVNVVIPETAAPGDSATVFLRSVAGSAVDTTLALVVVVSPTAGVEGDGTTRRHFATLEQNAPNPFGSGTTFAFTLPEAGDVSVDIYDAAGSRVTAVAVGRFEAGEHRVHWDGRGPDGGALPSGIYFCRLKASGVSLVRKVIVAR